MNEITLCGKLIKNGKIVGDKSISEFAKKCLSNVWPKGPDKTVTTISNELE